MKRDRLCGRFSTQIYSILRRPSSPSEHSPDLSRFTIEFQWPTISRGQSHDDNAAVSVGLIVVYGSRHRA